MTIRLNQWTIDVVDVDLMAAFWAAALGYTVDKGDDGAAKLFPPPDKPHEPTVWLQPSGKPKRDKNRLHPDLVADGDNAAEIERLLSLGATRADVGQTGEERFTVLADPEGNEFCVLDYATRRSGAAAGAAPRTETHSAGTVSTPVPGPSPQR